MKNTLAGVQRRIESCKIDGLFTLASGIKSSYYYDVKSLLLKPDALEHIVDYIHYSIAPKCKSIGGMETGAIPLITGLSLELWKPAFYIRKERKEYGTRRLIEGNIESPCLLVEDVLTTGHSILTGIEKLKYEEIEPNMIIAVVDRSDGQIAKEFKKMGIKYISLYKDNAQ